MRKNLFFVFIAAAAVMSGCSNNEVDESAVVKQDQLEFTSVVGKQTRATQIGSVDLHQLNTTLYLYNYKTTSEFKDAAAREQFFRAQPEPLTYNGSWTPGGSYTWSDLGTGNYLSIFSYYSPGDVLSGITEAATNYPAQFVYTVPAAINKQEDLLVAANVDMQKSVGIITLNFKHALSQLYFKAKLTGSGHTAVVKSIKVNGARSKGTFEYVVAPDLAEAGKWNTTTDTYNYTFAEGLMQNITSNITAVAIGTNGSLMLMPQAAASGFEFEVTYDAYIDGKLIGANIMKTAAMETLEMGKKYAYTLILPASINDNIMFDVTVTAWDESETAREVRFDNYDLKDSNDATTIANLITDYAPIKVSFLHEVNITGELTASTTIDLKNLRVSEVKSGSQIILKCTLKDWESNTNLSVTNVPNGWTVANGTTSLSGNGSITLTKD